MYNDPKIHELKKLSKRYLKLEIDLNLRLWCIWRAQWIHNCEYELVQNSRKIFCQTTGETLLQAELFLSQRKALRKGNILK